MNSSSSDTDSQQAPRRVRKTPPSFAAASFDDSTSPKHRVWSWVCFVAARWHWIAIALVAAFWWFRSHPETVHEGEHAPAFQTPLSDESTLLVGDGGEVLVLNFWASWCGSCRSEVADLDELHRKLSRRGVRVVGLSIEQESVAAIAQKARSLGASYPVGRAQNEVMQQYKVKMLPTTYVVNAKGMIVEAFVGGVSESRLEKAVSAAKAEVSAALLPKHTSLFPSHPHRSP